MHLKSNFMVSVDDALDEHVVGRRGEDGWSTDHAVHSALVTCVGQS